MTSARWVVTGGLGFIGSTLIRDLVSRGHEVLNLDAETYAGDARRIAGLSGVMTEKVDVRDPRIIDVIEVFRPDVVVHLAAETHVTRSESDEERFFSTNVEGTRNVLDGALRAEAATTLHVSTDEVYGSARDRAFKESDKEPGEGDATSPYARSKAVADDLALSYADRLPVVVVRPANCFGPYQHPEKAIPRWAIRALRGDRLPVWGDGLYVRDWMFVEDASAGLRLLVDEGEPGQVYNLAPQGDPLPNIEIATTIARSANRDESAVYLTAYDRPDHDRRYAIDASKVRELGWTPTTDLRARLAETVAWYAAHEDWWTTLVAEAEGLYADETERDVAKR